LGFRFPTHLDDSGVALGRRENDPCGSKERHRNLTFIVSNEIGLEPGNAGRVMACEANVRQVPSITTDGVA
jgi:hypothetical protein